MSFFNCGKIYPQAGGMNWEIGVDIYTIHCYVKNRKLRPYCAAQGTLLSAPADLNGEEIQNRGDTCMCIAGSLCCTAEINTTLKSSCTPVKINFKIKKIKYT